MSRPLTSPLKITEERNTEKILLTSHFIIDEILLNEHLLEVFVSFGKLEFVENELVFQNMLYFLGFSGQEINEEGTNKLEWKKARIHWTRQILDKLKEYNPFEEKEAVIFFAMVNRLIDVFAAINTETIRQYSYVIGRMVDFMRSSIYLKSTGNEKERGFEKKTGVRGETERDRGID